MKALKINVQTKTIEEIELGKGLQPIYDALGNDCDMFECPVELNHGDVIYCDEEALYHNNIGGFMMKGWAYPIVGNGLIVGTNLKTGDSISCKTTKAEIEPFIKFMTPEECQPHIDLFN